jgi:hypothetical protein
MAFATQPIEAAEQQSVFGLIAAHGSGADSRLGELSIHLVSLDISHLDREGLSLAFLARRRGHFRNVGRQPAVPSPDLILDTIFGTCGKGG